MKIGSMLAVSFVGAAAITLIVLGGGAARRDQDIREIREGCMTVGAVDTSCPLRFPDIERCHVEDCSDIKGNVGYWQDPSDPTGRSWWLVARPGMAEAPQKPGDQ